MNSFSTFLFARSGFRTGVARVLDIGSQFSGYNYSLSPDAADALAMYADWRTVGDDLRAGISQAASWQDPQQLWLFRPQGRKR
jgi:glutaredoxin-related protein